MAISKIEDVIRDIAEGKMVIMTDDEDRENEGDVVIAAEKITPEAITFMARTRAAKRSGRTPTLARSRSFSRKSPAALRTRSPKS